MFGIWTTIPAYVTRFLTLHEIYKWYFMRHGNLYRRDRRFKWQSLVGSAPQTADSKVFFFSTFSSPAYLGLNVYPGQFDSKSWFFVVKYISLDVDGNNLCAKCEVRKCGSPTLRAMRQPHWLLVTHCQGGEFFIYSQSAKPDKHLQLVNDLANIGNRKMPLYKITLVYNFRITRATLKKLINKPLKLSL